MRQNPRMAHASCCRAPPTRMGRRTDSGTCLGPVSDGYTTNSMRRVHHLTSAKGDRLKTSVHGGAMARALVPAAERSGGGRGLADRDGTSGSARACSVELTFCRTAEGLDQAARLARVRHTWPQLLGTFAMDVKGSTCQPVPPGATPRCLCLEVMSEQNSEGTRPRAADGPHLRPRLHGLARDAWIGQ